MNAMVVVGFAAALGVGLLGAWWLAWNNLGSRTLSLATATLTAATALWALQAFFELRPEKDRDYVPVAVAINEADGTFVGPTRKPYLQHGEQFVDAARFVNERALEALLRGRETSIFAEDMGRAATDYVMYNLLAFFTSMNADWQGHRVSYVGATRREDFIRLSRPGEYMAYSPSAVEALFNESGNLLAGVPLPFALGEGLLLPPDSELLVEHDLLSIVNPAFTVTFTVLLPGDQTGGGVEEGGGKRLTQWRGLEIETRYPGLRAHDRNSAKYRKWLERSTQGVREWFRSPQDNESRLISAPGGHSPGSTYEGSQPRRQDE